ncbi:MAG: hypothetical protein AAGF11_25165 [Myxococcota bacterium]
MSKMLNVWQLVGMMSLDGRLTLDETKVLTESLTVWASYVRNRGNKTWTARELGKSRRVIRSIIRRWEATGGDTQALPVSLRCWILGESDPAVVGPSVRALQADVEHELRMARSEAISDDFQLPPGSAAPLALPPAVTIDIPAEDARSGEEDRPTTGPAGKDDPTL